MCQGYGSPGCLDSNGCPDAACKSAIGSDAPEIVVRIIDLAGGVEGGTEGKPRARPAVTDQVPPGDGERLGSRVDLGAEVGVVGYRKIVPKNGHQSRSKRSGQRPGPTNAGRESVARRHKTEQSIR